MILVSNSNRIICCYIRVADICDQELLVGRTIPPLIANILYISGREYNISYNYLCMDMKFYRRASDNTKGLLTILLLSSVTGLCLYYNSLTPLTEEEDPCLWPDSVSAVSVKIHSRRSIELLETKQNENTKINFESSKIPSSEMQQKSTLTCNLKDFSKKSCDEMVCSNKIIPKLQTNPDLYLPESATKEINTFVLFLGHPRSGTTITGYLLDAHPHILLSTEYHVLSQIEENWEFHSNKINLYSALAFRQKQASKNVAERQEKKVSVFLNGSWNANYDHYIQVIGDKKASRTVETWLSNPDKSKATIEKLKKIVGISIKYIQVGLLAAWNSA